MYSLVLWKSLWCLLKEFLGNPDNQMHADVHLRVQTDAGLWKSIYSSVSCRGWEVPWDFPLKFNIFPPQALLTLLYTNVLCKFSSWQLQLVRNFILPIFWHPTIYHVYKLTLCLPLGGGRGGRGDIAAWGKDIPSTLYETLQHFHSCMCMYTVQSMAYEWDLEALW